MRRRRGTLYVSPPFGGGVGGGVDEEKATLQLISHIEL